MTNDETVSVWDIIILPSKNMPKLENLYKPRRKTVYFY